MNDSQIDSEEIVTFWFSEPVMKKWFNSTPEFDDEIRQRFEPVYKQAKQGLLDSWKNTATGCLALVILFDQFPLNMYRGKKQSFATEARSREVAEHAIAESFDEQLSDNQKAFIYMPYMHSESMADQERSVALYEKAKLNNNIRFARHHRDIVQRFGRFPHRNKILGRQSTDEELIYLQSKEAFHG